MMRPEMQAFLREMASAKIGAAYYLTKVAWRPLADEAARLGLGDVAGSRKWPTFIINEAGRVASPPSKTRRFALIAGIIVSGELPGPKGPGFMAENGSSAHKLSHKCKKTPPAGASGALTGQLSRIP